MSKIPTAKQFFNSKADKLESDRNDIPEWMIDESINFAKLHVTAALKAAEEKVHLSSYSGENCGKSGLQYSNHTSFVVEIDKQSILTAYPSENII